MRDLGDTGSGQFGNLRFGTGTGRVDHAGIEAGQLIGHQWAAKQIAGFAGHKFQPLSLSPTLIERLCHSGAALDGMNLGLRGQRQGKSATACEEIDDLCCPSKDFTNCGKDCGLTFAGGLKESAGRRHDLRLSELLSGGMTCGHDLTVPRQPGQVEALGLLSEGGEQGAIKRKAAGDGDIQAVLADRDSQTEFAPSAAGSNGQSSGYGQGFP